MQTSASSAYKNHAAADSNQPAYIGRFAPSPTGPLHVGSLFTALASYLDARANNGKWLLRIDDLDTPRNQPGAADAIFKCLESFGLHWDGGVYYQSRHINDYEQYLTELASRDLTYRCACSRKTLTEQAGDNKPGIYPGTCRNKHIPETASHAIRILADDNTLTFNDGLQGQITRQLNLEDGDFILKRRDNIIAYQFAVVVDDYLQGINHVVRGCDLLQETPKQIYLQQLLGFPSPAYTHVPLIVDAQGYKLSKQTLATAVDINKPEQILFELLILLKQNPLNELKKANVNELLEYAIVNWRSDALTLQQIVAQ